MYISGVNDIVCIYIQRYGLTDWVSTFWWMNGQWQKSSVLRERKFNSITKENICLDMKQNDKENSVCANHIVTKISTNSLQVWKSFAIFIVLKFSTITLNIYFLCVKYVW